MSWGPRRSLLAPPSASRHSVLGAVTVALVALVPAWRSSPGSVSQASVFSFVEWMIDDRNGQRPQWPVRRDQGQDWCPWPANSTCLLFVEEVLLDVTVAIQAAAAALGNPGTSIAIMVATEWGTTGPREGCRLRVLRTQPFLVRSFTRCRVPGACPCPGCLGCRGRRWSLLLSPWSIGQLVLSGPPVPPGSHILFQQAASIK